MNSEALVAQLKQMVRGVYQLTDIKEEAKGRTAEILKNAIASLSVGRKLGSVKVKFESPAVEFLYQQEPDIDGSEGGRFKGLYLNFEQKQFPELQRNIGAIIEEDVSGRITGTFYPKIEDAYDAWEEANQIASSS